MSTPEVSVVIPVRNRERMVVEAIASVQRQTEVDVEILVVDDGSTDASAEVVQRMAGADSRIVLLQAPHRGPAAARNQAVAAARGEYLAFVDSDDLCPPGRLRRQIDKLRSRPEHVAVVGAILGFDTLEPDGSPSPDPIHVPYHNAALHSATFRTRRFREFGPLDETLAYAEDVDYFLRLFEADARLLLEPEVASYYRYHAENMTRDIAGRQRGYLQAYARSVVRRRAMGRSRPLHSFFLQSVFEDCEIGGPQAVDA